MGLCLSIKSRFEPEQFRKLLAKYGAERVFTEYPRLIHSIGDMTTITFARGYAKDFELFKRLLDLGAEVSGKPIPDAFIADDFVQPPPMDWVLELLKRGSTLNDTLIKLMAKKSFSPKDLLPFKPDFTIVSSASESCVCIRARLDHLTVEDVEVIFHSAGAEVFSHRDSYNGNARFYMLERCRPSWNTVADRLAHYGAPVAYSVHGPSDTEASQRLNERTIAEAVITTGNWGPYYIKNIFDVDTDRERLTRDLAPHYEPDQVFHLVVRACQAGTEEAVRRGRLSYTSSSEGEHQAALVEAGRKLLAKGFSLNTRRAGVTPLQLSVTAGAYVTGALLDLGASLAASEDGGIAVLHAAVDHAWLVGPTVLQRLLEQAPQHVDSIQDGKTLLQRVLEAGATVCWPVFRVIGRLSSTATWQRRDMHGRTGLQMLLKALQVGEEAEWPQYDGFHAADSEEPSEPDQTDDDMAWTLELAVQSGADITAYDKEGMTALHTAAALAHSSLKTLLPHYKAYYGTVDVPCSDKPVTPLHLAAVGQALDFPLSVTLLLKNGANPHLKDHLGRSAVDIAYDGSVKDLLQAYMKATPATDATV